MSEIKLNHRALKRVLKRLGLDRASPPNLEQWTQFLISMEKIIDETDETRRLLERALSISADEMKVALRRQEEVSLQLGQASKMVSLGTLAAGIAHELNNPLTGVLGHAELLQESNLNEKQSKRVNRILELTSRMSDIVQHLLTLSRMPAKNSRTDFVLQNAVKDALRLIGNQMSYENIVIENKIPVEDIFVRGDLHGLLTVLQNLLSNSLDEFMKNKTDCQRIEISLNLEKSNEDHIVIDFRDNAGGIPKDVLERIFDPFFTTKDVGVGTGLGLSLSKQIISEFGGDLSAESEGEYTIFNIGLPRGQQQQQGAFFPMGNVQNDTFSGGLSAYKKSILIVDDEVDILDILDARLSSSYDVTVTDSPVNALQLLQKKNYDLLLTDLKMPVLSGEELIETANGMHPDMKILAMSGHVVSAAKHLFLGTGESINIICKPLPTKKELLAIIHRAFKAEATTSNTEVA